MLRNTPATCTAQMCTGFHPEKLGECATEFVRSYAEALMTFNELVAKGKL